MWNFMFFFNSCLLGVGLAMDAFSVSLANGLNEPTMKKSRMSLIAGTFAFFQFLMPLIGWLCVTTVTEYFVAFEKFIPWLAFALLGFIGGKMLYDGIKCKGCECEETSAVGFFALIVQGIATSIDALSVGFTIANHDFIHALVSCIIIAVVTFGICIGGVFIGKRFGTKLTGKANIFGGVILILIGIEILLTGLLG